MGKDCDGGYAEYIRLSTRNFIEIAEGVDHVSHPAGIGVVCDAVAMLLKVNKRTRTAPGEMVVVFGEIGGPGIHQVMLPKRIGAEHVIDAVVNNVVEAVVGLTDSRGVNVAVDYVSSTTTLRQAFASLGVKGSIVILSRAEKIFQVDAQAKITFQHRDLLSRFGPFCIQSALWRSSWFAVMMPVRPLTLKVSVSIRFVAGDGDAVHDALIAVVVVDRIVVDGAIVPKSDGAQPP